MCSLKGICNSENMLGQLVCNLEPKIQITASVHLALAFAQSKLIVKIYKLYREGGVNLKIHICTMYLQIEIAKVTIT